MAANSLFGASSSAAATPRGLPRLAGPDDVPPRPSFFRFLLHGSDNLLTFFPPECFQEEILGVKRLGRMFFTISHPEGVRRVLIDNVTNYPRSTHVRRLVEPAARNGLLVTDDEKWRRQRRTMAPSFDVRSVKRYFPIVIEETQSLLEKWDALSPGSVVDILPDMLRLTLSIIARTMFSIDAPEIRDIVRDSIHRYQTEAKVPVADLVGLPDWFPRGSWNARVAERVFADFNRVISRLIEERRAGGGTERDDLLSRLIAARDEATGESMPTEEVRDQVITMFWAGHETTAFSLTWTWYLIAQHPAVRAELEAELAEVLGGRAPDYEDQDKLVYTKMVFQEALRLYPPVYTLARQAVNDDVIMDRKIPAGSRVAVVPWIIHRHARFWDRPHEFDPERFTSANSAKRIRFTYLPMGGGPRVCIGSALAYLEANSVIAMIAARYRMRLAPSQKIVPQGLVTLGPQHGMRMILERRAAA